MEATRAGVALWIWMISDYFLAAEYLTVWEGFLLKAMKKQGGRKHQINYSSKFIQQITVSVPWIQIISLIFPTKKGGSATDLQLIFHFSKILWCSCPDSQYVQNQHVPSVILHSALVSWEKHCSGNWYLVYKKHSLYHLEGFLCCVMWRGVSSPQIIHS